MRMEIGLSQTLAQKQILSPQMIQSMEILVLNSQQLDERIEQELEENIALELVGEAPESGPDSETDESSDTATVDTATSDEGEAGGTDPALSGDVDASDIAGIDAIAGEIDSLRDRFEHLAEFQAFERANSPGGLRPRGDGGEDDKLDALQNTADAPPTLQEHLEAQLLMRSDLWETARRAQLGSVLQQVANAAAVKDAAEGSGAIDSPVTDVAPSETSPQVASTHSGAAQGSSGPVSSNAVSIDYGTLHPNLDDEDRESRFRALCLEIVYNLDAQGRLLYRPEDIAVSLERSAVESRDPGDRLIAPPVPLDEVLRALWTVEQLDPAGVGAIGGGTDAIRHCLLLQLDRDPGEYPLERRLITDHLDDIAKNRLPQIARATSSTLDDVKEAIDIIRELDPLPGKEFSTERNVAITPDVQIEEVDGEFRVVMDESSAPRLRISPYYAELLEKSRRDPEIRKYLKSKIDNAEWLLHAIQQRKSTLQRVAEEVVEHQQSYFKEGVRGLRPLKMQEIADKIGVNVSTVSRAISGKYFQAPGIIKDLKFLFTGGTVKDDGTTESRDAVILRIKDLIQDEDPKKPYSDARIVELLSKDGIHISRRTVTKYREAENIPSSRERRAF